jgi:hypothetical protein
MLRRVSGATKRISLTFRNVYVNVTSSFWSNDATKRISLTFRNVYVNVTSSFWSNDDE